MPQKILLIAYAFPPISAPEAFLAAKTLSRVSDFSVDVICLPPYPGFIPADHSLDGYVKERFAKIHRLSFPNWLKAICSSRFLPKLFFAVAQFPDRAVFFNRAAYRKAEELNPQSYAAVMTWSQFHSVHLVGLALKRKYPAMKWIAHFSDPWADNPFNRASWLTAASHRRQEKAVIAAADHVGFTSPRTVDLVMRKFPKSYLNKVSAIPHPFEADFYPPLSARQSRFPIIFRYLGKFYGKRNPDSLLRALEIIASTRPELIPRFRVEFVGGTAKKIGELSPVLRQSVAEVASVNYLTSLKLMQSSDVLLVIDAPAEVSVFLPCKLIDYLGARKKILGITPPGTSADLIRQMGGKCASPTDSQAIASLLIETIDEMSRENYSFAESSAVVQYRQSFSAETIAARISDLVRLVVRSR